MRKFGCLAVAALALMTLPGSASAQREVKHDGFWIGFGLGGGRNLSERIDGAQLAGGGGYLRLGGTPNERVLLGGEIIAWVRGESGVTLSRANATFTVLVYPDRSGGLFLKAGLGGSSHSVQGSSGTVTVTTTESGLGQTAGIGFDVRLARNFYLTPNLDILFQQLEGGVRNTIGLITLGATWH